MDEPNEPVNVVKRYGDRTGSRWIDICKRIDGTFFFRILRETRRAERGLHRGDAFVQTLHVSGAYATLDDADDDARVAMRRIDENETDWT